MILSWWLYTHPQTSLWYYINFRAIYIPAFINPLILYIFQSIIQPSIHQASDLLSIAEHYPAQHSTSLWFCINFRAIYSPSFVKPLFFYQFQSIIHTRIQQASDILSISEQYTSQHSLSIWYSINFRLLSSPIFNKPLVLYQFQINT